MWHDKLISVSNNGENTITSRHGGLVTLLEKEVINNILHVWCVLHQMDIVIKKVMKVMMDGLFYKIAHAFLVHLCTQLNLITEMDDTKCPEDTTRWVVFGKMFKWFLHHRRWLLHYTEEKQPIQVSLPAWWILCAMVTPLFQTMQVTFAKLQCQDLVMSQQMVEIEVFISNICINISNCHDNMDTSYNELDQNAYIKVDEWWMMIASIKGHIEDQGSWACNAFNALSAKNQDVAIHNIAVFSITLVNEFRQVQVERDSNNETSMMEAPLIMLAQLVHLRLRDFIRNILDPCCAHLSRFWSPGEIEDVEQDHIKLVRTTESRLN
ncbi:unnamed protein product [Sphagnum jensenii]|uniref:Uncharacterized protein n=1 Tax=Sphagnum jensenii TaxID=128206 RepID=A0ABP1BTD6_9BRYO